MHRLSGTLFGLLLVAGCATPQPAGTLVFRDTAGQIVATGMLRLPERLPGAGGFFAGTWSLSPPGNSFPNPEETEGVYAAHVYEGSAVYIDLRPGGADNNVVLSGMAANGVLSGKWFHWQHAGTSEKGQFTVALSPE